uniref:BZIP transcription factor n=3 Tax=Glycine subgen. Soja TaxID=1462606 RepID=A0A0R0FY25_SOYBN
MMFLSLHSNLHSLTLLQQAPENHTPKLLNSHSLDFPYRTPLILFQPPPRAPPQQQSYLRPPSPRHRRPRPRRHYQRPNSLEPRHSCKFIRSVEEAEAEAPQEGQELLRQQMYEEDHTGDSEKVTGGAEESARVVPEALVSQVAQLRKENQQILTSINITMQQYLSVEVENSVLRAQVGELSHRLESLNEIVDVLNATIVAGFGAATTSSTFVEPINNNNNNSFFNPLNMGYLNHPIMTSADILQY